MTPETYRGSAHLSAAGDVQIILVDIDRHAAAVEFTGEAEMIGMPVGDDDGLDIAAGAPRPRQLLVEITQVAKEACIHQGHSSA